MTRAWAVVILAAAGCKPHGPDALAARVRRLSDEYLGAYWQRFPEQATQSGVVRAPHDRLADQSPQAMRRWQKREDAWLAELRRIDPAALAGRSEWTAYGLMRDALEGAVATRVCRFELWGVSHAGNGALGQIVALGALQPVGTDEARARTLARWRAIPAVFATEIANLRMGLDRGYSAPRGNVRLVVAQLDRLLATPVAESPFSEPARRDPTREFGAALHAVIEAEVAPAVRRYRDFLATEYLPRAREAIGVSANPDGPACYRAAIRATTGLDLTPDSIHRLGLAAVAEIGAEMRRIAEQSFGTRDVGALLERLRADRRFTFGAREEILGTSRAALDRAKAAMPRWFTVVPRADVVIEPYPAYRERESVGEWNPPAEDGSRPGVVYLSTYDPRRKSRLDLEPLLFHETIPGHHLQGAIVLERGAAIPAIARYFWAPGFGEGWAEYAEMLADEMGLYSSDAVRFGALADVMLSATLLVVDTGINAFGWSRERGRDYIVAHTRVPRLRAEVPVDRYPVWPAQGLSYGLGRLEITRLRREAEAALGRRFDVREFHAHVLEDGAVPLPMLREKIERWITGR